MTPEMINKPKVLLECSSCRAPLCEVIIAKENNETHKVVAHCCFCNDKSFKKTIGGRLVYSSTEYCHATPEPVYKPRQFLDEPYEPTDEIIVTTAKIKEWRKK